MGVRALKANTALSVTVGPFLDASDAKTPLTSLTHGNISCQLIRGITASALTVTASGGNNDLTHIADGYYALELTAGNISNNGSYRVTFTDSTGAFLPFHEDFEVQPAHVYDSRVTGNDFQQVDVVQWRGVQPNNLISGRVDGSAGALAADVITASAFDESTAFPLKQADTGSTAVARTGADADTLQTLSDEIAALQTTTDAIETDTQDIQARLPTALTAGGNIKADALLLNGAAPNNISAADVNAQCDTAISDAALATAANLATVDTVVDAIKATTDKIDDTLEDDVGTFRFTANALEEAPTGGSGDATEAKQDSIIALIGTPSTDLAADIATRASQTSVDDLPTNAELTTALGTLNDLDATEVQTAATAALNAYDPPTKAELDSGFAGLNDLSAAQVNAEVDSALADYDAPTKAELDSGLAGLSIPTAAANADAVWAEVIAAHVGSGTAAKYLRVAGSATGGKLSGAATTTNTIRDLEDGANAITATVDEDGNRTAVTYG